jgi:hypothetical protein
MDADPAAQIENRTAALTVSITKDLFGVPVWCPEVERHPIASAGNTSADSCRGGACVVQSS